MIDRKSGPAILPVKNLTLPPPSIYRLSNGIQVYETNMGTQQVVKIELVFDAGRPFEHKQLAARATASMMREGTRRYSAAEIAEQFDFYGSSLGTPFNLDTANIVIHSLNRHLDKIMPLVLEMLEGPVYPQEELQAFVQRNQQLLLEDLSKPDVVAYRQFTELIFGDKHPYGYNSYPDTYALLRREDLLEHYQRLYTCDNCTIFISGRIDEDVRRIIDQTLGQWSKFGAVAPPAWPVEVHAPEKVFIRHPHAVQTAIRIGRRLFNRHHPDYCGMFVLNNVLGGYFGSRLMNNIREEKGYTYNIYSSLDTMHLDGCLYVGTETGNAFTTPAIKEIYREIELLRRAPIGKDEMEMVRSYQLGTLLTGLDGPFNVSEMIRTLISEDLPLAFFDQLVETIETITPAALQQLAEQYLDPADLWEVVVGETQE